ncbi:30S ribosomal protein S27e [Candidatus Woesearchaeota archaeon CG10_big_fil_rev_8_21_14_0_10_34_12]|nr:MAG: 30S ribosomal protein S27e [Candidatus Woesearchaeota archaeon CG10_big_fil_rev_8_21_14_0_10_34_12]
MESKFIKIRCSNANCKNEQIVFGKATTPVKCHKCETVLTEPTGGKAKIKAKVLEILS